MNSQITNELGLFAIVLSREMKLIKSCAGTHYVRMLNLLKNDFTERGSIFKARLKYGGIQCKHISKMLHKQVLLC